MKRNERGRPAPGHTSARPLPLVHIMDHPPHSEPAAVRHAVLASIEAGEITPMLAELVHGIARRRIGVYHTAEDVAQEVLLGLVRRLHQIDPKKNLYGYVCSGIVKRWKKCMEKRNTERRYL